MMDMDNATEEQAESPDVEKAENPSVFLSKADLGGKTCKPGDTLTLKVVDVDQETGDVQAELSADSGYGSNERDVPFHERELDAAMGPEKEAM
jgi:diaminopimelate decarboxylase